MSLYAWKYSGDNTVVYTTSDEPSGGDPICKSNGIPYEESELYILYGGSTTASVNPYISSVSIDPETMLPYLKCFALPEGMSRPLPTNFMRYSDGDILPISRLKHAGVTYEIEDEKARQDIATKQDALTTQTAYSAKGSATKVPQITTNNLGQVTNITEVTISQPTVNNKTITIQKNSTTVDSFTLNQSTDKTINITVPTKTSDITNDSGFLTEEVDTLGTVLNRGNSATTDINMNSKDWFNAGVKLTSYYYSTSQTPNTQYYWYKLEPPTSGSKADRYFISIDSDVNYPQNRATFLLDISKYSSSSYNVSLNCLAMTGGKNTHVLNVAIDADGYVYVQSDAVWSSYMRFVRYGTESSTISYTQVGLAAFGTAAGFTPVKMITDTGCIRLLNGAESGTYYTVLPSHYFRGDLVGNADTATKATKDGDGNTISTTYLKSHQSIKSIKSDNTTAQSTSSSEAVAGTGTINLHKISKTGAFSDLLSKPTSLSGYGITDAYTKTEVDGMISSVYKPAGSVAFASLPALSDNVLGNVYNVTDAFTTTTNFVEGAGKSYPAGTNVVVVNTGTTSNPTYKFDVLAGFVDLSSYVPTSRTVNGKALSANISLTASDVGAISSHQSIKSLKTDNTTAQTTSSSETIAGSGTINLHKVSKTGSYSDLLNKPTIPATNVIPATNTANKVLVSTTTSGTAKWSDFSTAGLLKTNTSGVVSVDTTSYGTYSKPSGGIPASDLAESYYLASNPSGYTSNAGTVTSVRVQAGTGLASSTSTAQSTTLNTTISIASGYKLPTTTEWSNKQDKLTTQTAYTSKGTATKVPQITTNTLGQVTGITEVDITHPTELPSQTGQSGKFLTTNGSTVSWAAASTNIDNSTITKNGSNQIQTVGYKDVRTSNTLKTWTGTRAQYDAIATKDANTLYNITDDTDTTAAILELLYPVGAVYIGTMDVCPLATLGIGSWEKIAEDQVLQGSSSNHNAGATIAAGLPNITGSIDRPGQNNNSGNNTTNYLTGSFYFDSNTYSRRNTSESGTGYLLKFDASRSSTIYGNSNTVQPPAFVVNIWRRIS